MRNRIRHLHIVLLAAVLALLIPTAGYGQGFEEARIYIDRRDRQRFGFHVSLDGEDWTDLKDLRFDRQEDFRPIGKRRLQEPGAHGAVLRGCRTQLG